MKKQRRYCLLFHKKHAARTTIKTGLQTIIDYRVVQPNTVFTTITTNLKLNWSRKAVTTSYYLYAKSPVLIGE